MTSRTGEQLRDLRLGARLTLHHAADMLGLSTVELGEFERGVRPLTPELWHSLSAPLVSLASIEADRLAHEIATALVLKRDNIGEITETLRLYERAMGAAGRALPIQDASL